MVKTILDKGFYTYIQVEFVYLLKMFSITEFLYQAFILLPIFFKQF